MRRAYYNEFEPYCAQWLRNLIAQGLIPDGEVDDRSIADVEPQDLAGFGQCHFFAGLGGWGRALRLAGWPDDRPVWTGSCPCQPFSVAGRGRGTDDERHLWPEFYRLIRECRPAVVFGEQVAGKAGLGWLDGVFADLEGSGYACGAAVVPACGVGAPHRRERLWFVAQSESWRGDGPLLAGQRQTIPGVVGSSEGSGSPLADANLARSREGREQRGGQLSRAGGDQEARSLVDAASERRGEGRAEPEFRGGRVAAAGAGSANALADDAGGKRSLPPSEVAAARSEGAAGGCSSDGPLGDAADESEGRRGLFRSGEGRGAHQEWASGEPSRRSSGVVGDANSAGPQEPAGERGDAREERTASVGTSGCGFWDDALWLAGADGKSRRVGPGLRLLAHGIPARVAKLRALGNAIVPQVAAEFIAASLEAA